MSNSRAIGKLIREARKLRKLTQTELGKLINTNQAVISTLETGGLTETTTQSWLDKVHTLPLECAPKPIEHDSALIQRLREEETTAREALKRVRKLLRRVEAGKPINHLL